MMRSIVWLLLGLWGCAPGMKESKGSLTANDMETYIAVYKQLKQQAPDILHDLQGNENEVNTQQAQFTVFEDIIKKGGLKDYPEFVRLNAKIGTVFAIMQASKAMDRFQTMHDNGMTQFDDAAKELQAQINHPEVPEATKAELRKTLDTLRMGKQTVQQNWAANKPWADFVMDKAKKITGSFVAESEIELVAQYESQLLEAYTGLPAKVLEQGDLE